MLLQIHQDFSLLFGPDTAAKLLEKWHTSYKRKVIREAERLTTTPALQSLLRSVKNQHIDEPTEDHSGIKCQLKLFPRNCVIHSTLRDSLDYFEWDCMRYL